MTQFKLDDEDREKIREAISKIMKDAFNAPCPKCGKPYAKHPFICPSS